MESVLASIPSSRRGSKKVLRWLENNVTSDVCDCCNRMNVAFCANNSITVVKEEQHPKKTGSQYPRFQRNSLARRVIRRLSRASETKVKPILITPSVQTSAVVSVSSAYELKTYLKNGYKCTLC